MSATPASEAARRRTFAIISHPDAAKTTATHRRPPGRLRFKVTSIVLRCAGSKVMKHEMIETNPEVMGGKPVVKGTRLTVEMILRELGDGMSVEEMLAEHPRLTADAIRAAQAFAADYLRDEEIVFG